MQDCGRHALTVALFSIDQKIIHANVYRVQDINKQCKKLNYIVYSLTWIKVDILKLDNAFVTVSEHN